MNRLLPIRRSHHAACTGERGFSLIELMVAITLSLILMLALIALFLNINRSNNEMAKANTQIENGRFAIQLLQSDLEQAGFWGSYVPQFDDLSFDATPSDVPTAIPAPCLAYASWDAAYKNNLLAISIQAYDAAPAGCSALITNQKANTDILVVRHAAACVPGDANCEADTTGKLYFQSSLCENEIQATPAQRYVLDTANFTLKKKGCTGVPPAPTVGTLAEKRKFISDIYYIRDYANTQGDGIPTLVRSQFDLSGGTLAQQAPVALIEGIDSFKLELGIDDHSDSGALSDYTQAITWANTSSRTSPTNRGDGIPDGAFIRCTTAVPCTTAQLSNTVAVKLYVLARSTQSTPGYTDDKTYQLGSTTLNAFGDQYKRHVFSTTVRLVNISGRRETP